MGGWKFDRDKAWRAVARPGMLELLDVLEEANRDKSVPLEVEVTVRGAKTTTFQLQASDFSEIVEILKLSIPDRDDPA